ncbi:MAG: hypothetical protein LDLANPLL_01952 [Turneriella sp.]|nr:hypothetical protein [Turneriella sp.]
MHSINVSNSTVGGLSSLPSKSSPTRVKESDSALNDFASYLLAAAPTPAQTFTPPIENRIDTKPPTGEKPSVTDKIYDTEKSTPQLQKAGAAKTEAVNTDRNTAAEKQLFETLGINAKTQGEVTSTAVKKLGKEALHALKKTEHPNEAIKVNNAFHKSTAIQSTLAQLQKTPDTILLNSDGLRRLGEKLGHLFLSKVEGKLNEKKDVHKKFSETSTPTLKEWNSTFNDTYRAQKAGEPKQDFSRAAKTRVNLSKNTLVSRETQNQDTAEKKINSVFTEAKAISNNDTLNTRAGVTDALRLSESAHTVRSTENIRTTHETNPANALSRQLTDIISRARVLVTDNQNAQFSVKLFPRELGRMEIDLKMIEGEIRGKIVVQSESVKSELQNFLNQNNNASSFGDANLNQVNIEVQSGSAHAQNSEKSANEQEALQNLITRVANEAYDASLPQTPKTMGLYA